MPLFHTEGLGAFEKHPKSTHRISYLGLFCGYNYDEPYFNHEIFVERIYSGDKRDEDPEETGFELSEESEISSESF